MDEDAAPLAADPASRVLLVAREDRVASALLDALSSAELNVDWTKTVLELSRRTERRDLLPPRVVFLDAALEDAKPEPVIGLLRAHFPVAVIVALGSDLDEESKARLLGLGVPTLGREVNPAALVGLTFRLGTAPNFFAGRAFGDTGERPKGPLGLMFTEYVGRRGLSQRQQSVLGLFLLGNCDKQIASNLNCAESTVYEHWRRMAKKARGAHKGDVVADFHRFLSALPLSD